MKIRTCIIFVYLIALIKPSVAQTVAPVLQEEIDIDSKVLNEKCSAFVFLPENYRASTDKLPVVYVLDGEYYSSLATEAAALLAQSRLAPSCIIIGVKTNNRDRDFSPAVDADAGQNQDSQNGGGADRFLEYLKNELVPAVDGKYRTLPNRIIVGHSTGGLLAYYSLYKTPGLFQSIISIDASTWWNKGKVGREIMEYLTRHPEYQGKIFECRKDINIPVRFPANKELLNYLDKQRPRGLQYTYLELPNETHGTIVFPGIYYGLKAIFADYQAK